MNTTDVLQEFGQSIGLQGLSTAERDHATLRLESGRFLTLEPGSQGELLVGLSQPVAYNAADWLLRAWKRTHHRHSVSWPVQVALRDTDNTPHLVALVRLPEADQSLSNLQRAIEHLSRWLDQLQTA